MMMELSDIYHGYMADGDFKHLRALDSHFVPGDGNPDARVCFVGEAPGAVEDKRRLPFQGPSGRVLDKHLSRIGLGRDEVFVTNLLKYRPPNNRDPEPHEIQNSLPYLGEELISVRPEFVVLLGKLPTLAFFPGFKFSDLIGITNLYNNRFTVLVTYHPAATLYNPALDINFGSHFDLLAALLRGADDNGRSGGPSPTR